MSDGYPNRHWHWPGAAWDNRRAFFDRQRNYRRQQAHLTTIHGRDARRRWLHLRDYLFEVHRFRAAVPWRGRFDAAMQQQSRHHALPRSLDHYLSAYMYDLPWLRRQGRHPRFQSDLFRRFRRFTWEELRRNFRARGRHAADREDRDPRDDSW